MTDGDAFKTVMPGDSLVIPAGAWNAMLGLVRRDRMQTHDRGPGTLREAWPTGVVPIKNESGAARARYDVLGIDEPLVLPEDDPDLFASSVALRGTTPTAEHAGRFVVLLEPVDTEAIGRAMIAGVCAVRVEMLDESHRSADVYDGQPGRLRSCPGGAAALVWIEPVAQRDEPTIAWSIARIGNAGGSAAGTALGYCRIESSIGTTPPFIYTARRVVPDGHGGFGPPQGDDFDLYNLAEIGAGGAGVHEVPDGAIVAYWQDPASGAFFFDRSFYRGTY